MNDRDFGMLAVGGAIAALLLWVAYSEAGSDSMQPRFETADSSVNPNLGMVIDLLDTGDHYFHPNHCVQGQGQIFTAHRYPTISGANVTALIRHGLTPMSNRAPQDDDWRIMPPGDQPWLGVSNV